MSVLNGGQMGAGSHALRSLRAAGREALNLALKEREKATDELTALATKEIRREIQNAQLQMKQEQENENNEDDSFLGHWTSDNCLQAVSRKPFNVSMEYYSLHREADE